ETWDRCLATFHPGSHPSRRANAERSKLLPKRLARESKAYCGRRAPIPVLPKPILDQRKLYVPDNILEVTGLLVACARSKEARRKHLEANASARTRTKNESVDLRSSRTLPRKLPRQGHTA